MKTASNFFRKIEKKAVGRLRGRPGSNTKEELKSASVLPKSASEKCLELPESALRRALVANRNNALYPWRSWFTKGRFVVRRGRHYTVPTSSFVNQIRQAASRLGYSASIEDRDTELVITVVPKVESENESDAQST